MKIQLKRSSALENGLAKEPTSAQMEYGELAVNFNTVDPSIFIKDSTNAIIKIAGDGAFGDASTLQQVTDEGNFTTNNIEIGGTPTANAGTPNLQLKSTGSIDIVGTYGGSAITVTDAGQFGSLTTTGNLQVGQADDPQTATIAGNIGVSGTSTLATLSVSENATFQKPISVDGSVTATTLTTNSGATISGGLTVGNDSPDGTGAVDVLGDLNVKQGQLNVTNDAEIDGDCDVSGVLNVNNVNSTGNISTDGNVGCSDLTTTTSAKLQGDQPLTIKTPLTDTTAAVKFQNNSNSASTTVWKLLANGESEQEGLATFKAGITANGTTTIDSADIATANITTYDLAALPALP